MDQRTLADLVGGTARPTGDPLPALRRYNVVARFPDGDMARAALLELERTGIDGSKLSYVPTAAAATAPHPTGPRDAETDPTGVTGDAARSALQGGIVGGLIGAALFLVGYLVISDGARLGGAIAAVLAGAGLCGAIGAILRAFSRLGASPAWSGAHQDTRLGPAIVGIHTDDEREARQAAGHCRGAFAVDVVDADGRPAW